MDAVVLIGFGLWVGFCAGFVLATRLLWQP